MKWSAQIGRLAGIPLKLHVTFPLIIPLIVVQHAEQIARQTGSTVTAALPQALPLGLLFVFVIFSSVVLHELGHALTARRYGIGTRDINLLPIGGVAMLERMPADPKQEIVIAVAGPAVSFLLAGAGFLIWTLSSGTLIERPFQWFFFINVVLGTFNLVPALPMDGGRILRGALALWRGRGFATRVAANVAKVIAVGFIVGGLFGNWSLALIGLFVYFGASTEGAHEQMRQNYAGLTARNAMVTEFRVLTPETQVTYAAEVAARSMQNDFPVMRDGFVIGIVTRARLHAALVENKGAEPAAWHMDRVPRFATPDTPLIELLPEIARTRTAIPVLDGGRLVGMIPPERLRPVHRVQTVRRPGGFDFRA